MKPTYTVMLRTNKANSDYYWLAGLPLELRACVRLEWFLHKLYLKLTPKSLWFEQWLVE